MQILGIVSVAFLAFFVLMLVLPPSKSMRRAQKQNEMEDMLRDQWE